jgi:hypothetical protein
MYERNSGWANIIIVILVVVLGLVLVGGFQKVDLLSTVDQFTTYSLGDQSGSESSSAIQLRTLQPIENSPTPTLAPGQPSPTRQPTRPPTQITNNPAPPNPTSPPAGGNSCPKTAPIPNNTCQCQAPEFEVTVCDDPTICQQCYSLNATCKGLSGNQCMFKPGSPGFDQYQGNPNCASWCMDKPILYFYPLAETFIDVLLTLPGKVVVSDPYYPEDTGWKNVKAFPDGTLHYNNTRYHYLFYESELKNIIRPTTGVFIARKDLHTSLTTYTHQFGLNALEQKEFLDYWVPRLQKLNAPYILFSVYTDEEKVVMDKVTVTPNPDTFIHLLAYFKPVNAPYSIQPLAVPQSRPERIGFTVVEWGGTIDSGNQNGYLQ